MMIFQTNKHENLAQLADSSPVLLVFLRHFGCTFCRETMTELAEEKKKIESLGVQIVVVHMAEKEVAERLFEIYDLEGIYHISDPDLELYKAFGLKRATLWQFFGLRNWWRAFVAGVLKGHFVGSPLGDTFQMPGVFLYYKNMIVNRFRYNYVSDRPDFIKLIQSLYIF